MKRHPRIWGVQHLPSDARRIIPVPSGGALVLCTHMLLYYAQVRCVRSGALGMLGDAQNRAALHGQTHSLYAAVQSANMQSSTCTRVLLAAAAIQGMNAPCSFAHIHPPPPTPTPHSHITKAGPAGGRGGARRSPGLLPTPASPGVQPHAGGALGDSRQACREVRLQHPPGEPVQRGGVPGGAWVGCA